MLKQGVLPALSARDTAATLLRGFARYRDLKTTSKFLTVGRRCSPQQRDLLMQFVDGISGVGSIPDDAVDADVAHSVRRGEAMTPNHLSRSSSDMSSSDMSSSETPQNLGIDDAWQTKPCIDDAWDDLEMLFSMPSTPSATTTTTTITTTHREVQVANIAPASLAVDTLIRRIRGHTFALGRGNSFFILMGSGGGGFSLATEGEQGDAGGTIYCTQG